ncbi:MAG: hypothetical protein ACI9LM_001058 [Alteromonadaceae bacterium]|jgi:uncharacterized protein YcbX/ferredoxin-NADP reductase
MCKIHIAKSQVIDQNIFGSCLFLGEKMTTSTVTNISIYPIKSTAGIHLSTSWVDALGLSFDRRFVVSDNQGQFFTARTEPTLCLIQANITATGLVLTAPNMPQLIINYDTFSKAYQPITVWNDTIDGQQCAKEHNRWFSQYLNKSCQLLYFGEKSQRLVKESNNSVSFADGYPLLLISQASLTDLNQRSSTNDVLEMSRFRPNIVVGHCLPFAEDSWQHIRIGEVEFELSKPCSRCVFTTLNPLTGEKHPQQEPLKTLKTYRQIASGDVMFGQNLIPLNQGKIKQGDTVEVLKTKTPPVFFAVKQLNKSSTLINKSLALINRSTAENLTLICEKIIDETHDVKTFIFKNTRDEIITYKAGQHLPLALTIDDETVNRCYTLSSSPTRPHTLAITVKKIVNGYIQGTASSFFHDVFLVGDTLKCKQPSGNFHLEDKENSKVLLLSAGSGITPMLAMLKVMTDQAIANDVVFFHSAHSEKDLIAEHDVAALAKQHGHCKIHYTLTRSSKADSQYYQGRISKQILTNITDLTQRQVYVCGPKPFRELAKSLLLTLGLDENHYHEESYGLRLQEEITPEKVVEVTKKINISFNSWNKNHQGNNKDTLLEQAEESGIMLPYSCRGGMCGCCKVKLEQGNVEQLADDGLTDNEKTQGYILACSCIPKTDLIITAG